MESTSLRPQALAGTARSTAVHPRLPELRGPRQGCSSDLPRRCTATVPPLCHSLRRSKPLVSLATAVQGCDPPAASRGASLGYRRTSQKTWTSCYCHTAAVTYRGCCSPEIQSLELSPVLPRGSWREVDAVVPELSLEEPLHLDFQNLKRQSRSGLLRAEGQQPPGSTEAGLQPRRLKQSNRCKHAPSVFYFYWSKISEDKEVLPVAWVYHMRWLDHVHKNSGYTYLILTTFLQKKMLSWGFTRGW